MSTALYSGSPTRGGYPRVRSQRSDSGGRDGRGGLSWASLVGGSALAALGAWRGIARRSVPGAAVAAVGGYLIYRGATAERVPREFTIERSVTINTTPEEAYGFWHNFENFPRFMRHLESVKVTGQRWSQWVARTPAGQVSWHAEIVDDRQNELISWRSLPGSDVENYGSVCFRKGLDGKGTVVTVHLQFQPARRGSNIVGKILGKVPDFQVREDLRRFKALIEAGEIPTVEGQPSGRRSATVSLIRRLERQYGGEPHGVREARSA